MKCIKCESNLKENSHVCNHCGYAHEETEFAKINAEYLKSKKSKKKFLIISSLVILIGVSSLVTNSLVTKHKLQIEAEKQLKIQQDLLESQQKERLREIKDYSWVPSGYAKFSDNYNLAYKTISYDAANCYSNCWGFIVISKKPCTALRIEANITRNETILDSSSDFASNVPAFGKVIMKIVSSADLPWQASVTSATCT